MLLRAPRMRLGEAPILSIALRTRDVLAVRSRDGSPADADEPSRIRIGKSPVALQAKAHGGVPWAFFWGGVAGTTLPSCDSHVGRGTLVGAVEALDV